VELEIVADVVQRVDVGAGVVGGDDRADGAAPAVARLGFVVGVQEVAEARRPVRREGGA